MMVHEKVLQSSINKLMTGHMYERADRLAGGAMPFSNLEMTAADVVDSVTKFIHEKEELGEHTWCMQRLREKEIKRGDSALVSLRGNQRHIATHLTTGAMSKAGL
jgi:hypothetical protein